MRLELMTQHLSLLHQTLFHDLICPAVSVHGPLSRESASHPRSKRLASDLWCFVARYAYAPICGHHVDLLVEAHLTSSPSDNVYLRALLHRLSGLLSAASRDKVTQQIILYEISLPVTKSASICTV